MQVECATIILNVLMFQIVGTSNNGIELNFRFYGKILMGFPTHYSTIFCTYVSFTMCGLQTNFFPHILVKVAGSLLLFAPPLIKSFDTFIFVLKE